jgi:hypothetical protein
MIGVSDTAAAAYQHRAERLRLELADARSAQRRGEPRAREQVEALEQALAELREDAARCGIPL